MEGSRRKFSDNELRMLKSENQSFEVEEGAARLMAVAGKSNYTPAIRNIENLQPSPEPIGIVNGRNVPVNDVTFVRKRPDEYNNNNEGVDPDLASPEFNNVIETDNNMYRSMEADHTHIKIQVPDDAEDPMSEGDEMDGTDEFKDNNKEYGHLKFLELLMGKSASTRDKRRDQDFLPKDLGIKSSSSSSSSDSSTEEHKEGENDLSSPGKDKINDNSSSGSGDIMQRHTGFLDIKRNISIKNNNEEDESKSLRDSPNRSIHRQNTIINDALGKGLLNDILKQQTDTRISNSFHSKPMKEHWRLCIFELGKKQYHIFENKLLANYNIPIVPEDETVIVCVNFSHKELRMLLIDRLDVNPIMFYECMMLSPVDKVFEFNDRAIFYNMVITREYIDDEPLIMRIIRKNNIAVIIVKELENDSFRIPNELASKFKFSRAKDIAPSQSFNLAPQSISAVGDPSGSSSRDEEELHIAEGEIGKVIIQKMRTFKPRKNEQVTIDYILFWL